MRVFVRDELISVSGHFLVAVHVYTISHRDGLIPGRFHPFPKYQDETRRKIPCEQPSRDEVPYVN